MTKSQAEDFLYDVLRAMRNQTDYAKRYELQRIGESLLGEYKDVSPKTCRARIESNS